MNNLRFLREQSNLSLHELGILTGINVSMLSDLERGNRTIGSKLSMRLAYFFEASIDFIAGDEMETPGDDGESIFINDEAAQYGVSLEEYLRGKKGGRIIEVICYDNEHPIKNKGKKSNRLIKNLDEQDIVVKAYCLGSPCHIERSTIKEKGEGGKPVGGYAKALNAMIENLTAKGDDAAIENIFKYAQFITSK